MVDHLRLKLRKIAAGDYRNLNDAEQPLEQLSHLVVERGFARGQGAVKIEYDETLHGNVYSLGATGLPPGWPGMPLSQEPFGNRRYAADMTSAATVNGASLTRSRTPLVYVFCTLVEMFVTELMLLFQRAPEPAQTGPRDVTVPLDRAA